MPMENDLGTGSDFDMQDALAQMSEGLGFEADAPGAGDGDAELDGIIDNATVEAPAGKAPEAPTVAAEAPPIGTPASDVPKTWRKEAAELWGTLPETARAEILKREEDMFKGLESYKADAQIGRSMKSVLDPYMPVLQQYGIEPTQQVASLMQAHHTLALGTPEQKSQLFRQLAADYGVNLGELASSAEVFIDPAVQALQSQVNSLQSTLTARERAEQQTRMASITTEIETFASDPKNAHFDTVANDIAAMLKSGAAKTLQEAYEKAVWANPVTRQQEIVRQQRETIESTQREATERAKAAKRASSAVVHAKPRSVSGTAPAGSMDDTLRETLAAIKSRASN